jgi:hypothetical protein
MGQPAAGGGLLHSSCASADGPTQHSPMTTESKDIRFSGSRSFAMVKPPPAEQNMKKSRSY